MKMFIVVKLCHSVRPHVDTFVLAREHALLCVEQLSVLHLILALAKGQLVCLHEDHWRLQKKTLVFAFFTSLFAIISWSPMSALAKFGVL